MCMVSIVIPYYNRSTTLIRALESVRLQTYKNFELILVNDGSTDDSEQMAKKYLDHFPEISVQYISQENKGPSSARNNGVRHSKGRYIAFLDSDDAWDPCKLEIQVGFMEKNPDVMLSGTNYVTVTERKKNRYPLEPEYMEAGFYHMLFKIIFATPTVIIRKGIFRDDNFWFLEGKHQGEDNLLYFQVLRKYRGVRLSKPLASVFKMEYGIDGLTANIKKIRENDLDNLNKLYKENSRSEKKIYLFLFCLLYIHYYLKHFKRIIRCRCRKVAKLVKNILVKENGYDKK
ncbi:glycosyltransferase family 2 protein [Dehalobacter sp. TBBPA1]|uniref:glycosyltransferase family 2 protein n=1 Tax=Dehalobacter sp. TBBPA1 TaxID=3235037 RepID=UPI0034A29EE1